MHTHLTLRTAGYLTTNQAGESLGVRPDHVRQLLRAGDLSAAGGIGRFWLLRVEDVEALRRAPGWATPQDAEKGSNRVSEPRFRHMRMRRRDSEEQPMPTSTTREPDSATRPWHRPNDAFRLTVEKMSRRVRTLLGLAPSTGPLGDRPDFEAWQTDVVAILGARAHPITDRTSDRSVSPSTSYVRRARYRHGGLPHRP